MEPVSLILEALTSGAAKGITESAADVVKDAYSGLKRMISKRLAGNKTAEVALAEYGDDPETWKAPLAKALLESGSCADPAVIEAAQRLMSLLDDAGARAGKYNVDVRGAQGVQVGDSNQQVNVFSTLRRTRITDGNAE